MKIVKDGVTTFEVDPATGNITTGGQNLAQPGGSSTPQFQAIVIANPITYTNAASGGLEPAGQQSRIQLDLRNAVNVVGQCLFSVAPNAAVGKLVFQYSTDGTIWLTLLDMGTGGYTANVLKISSATAVPDGAKVVNCLIRVIVVGDGVVDPVCQKAQLMFQGA